jgi:hypothetical protein
VGLSKVHTSLKYTFIRSSWRSDVPLYLVDVKEVFCRLLKHKHTCRKRRLHVRRRWSAKMQHRFDCPLRMLITGYSLSLGTVRSTYALADLEVNLGARSWSALLLSSRNHTSEGHACCFITRLTAAGTHDLAHLNSGGS